MPPNFGVNGFFSEIHCPYLLLWRFSPLNVPELPRPLCHLAPICNPGQPFVFLISLFILSIFSFQLRTKKNLSIAADQINRADADQNPPDVVPWLPQSTSHRYGENEAQINLHVFTIHVLLGFSSIFLLFYTQNESFRNGKIKSSSLHPRILVCIF